MKSVKITVALFVQKLPLSIINSKASFIKNKIQVSIYKIKSRYLFISLKYDKIDGLIDINTT